MTIKSNNIPKSCEHSNYALKPFLTFLKFNNDNSVLIRIDAYNLLKYLHLNERKKNLPIEKGVKLKFTKQIPDILLQL